MQYATQRLTLYAHSLYNTLGRALGRGADAYTAQQRANAQYIYDYFSTLPGGGLLDGYAVCGNTDGELSLILTLRGDKTLAFPEGSAGGMAQWHQPRQQLILAHTFIDVWKQTDVASQCRAMHAEITEPWSAYRHVLAQMQAASTLENKIGVLVSKFEQSGSQARDVARRTMLARNWQLILPQKVTS